MVDNNFEKEQLIKKTKSIPRWYTQVIQLAQLADYGPVRGTMVIRPYGYAIWENIQREFDGMIKEFDVENAYFPLFIPMRLLKKEKKHVEGFAPELAVVTHGGGKKLAEPLAIRPTSETIMYETYAKWISSWRDLPLKINQWNNVVRWEKRTYFFLRTLEFLWQEGHTVHATHKEAQKMVMDALNAYEKLYKEIFAISSIVGEKSDAEKFAGAERTYSIEILMPDGKILQGATSHHLSDNFSKVFNIQFQDKKGKLKFAHQTSWGLSTRSIGGMILVHGDDSGLIIPPRLAPVKAVIIPILGKRDEKILKYCQRVKKVISKFESNFPGKVEILADLEKTYGWKVNESETRGVPLMISVGAREMDNRTATINYRLADLDKKLVRISNIGLVIEEMLILAQEEMHKRANKELKRNIHDVDSYKEFRQIMRTKRGFIKTYWCEGAKCEAKIKNETKATTRVKLIGAKKGKGKCIYCGKRAYYKWYFGQSY